jgi:hypothetical protein
MPACEIKSLVMEFERIENFTLREKIDKKA